jgi:D-alanyl-D-alanine carboxypeptidase (penicillin-binding protein 5/6)
MVLVGAIGIATPIGAAAISPPFPPVLSARAAILMDARNGALLYEKNAFRQMDPASTTKIMTALLIIEHGHLNRIVTVSQRADATTGSSLHIRHGQQYTRLDLLRGMLLRSGNDASVALAESDAGSVTRFVAEMNVKAQQLGAFNTSYENTHGLTRPGHYTSAYDLALITRAALRLPIFQDIVRSQELTIREIHHQSSRTIANTNLLLYGFAGADGVKTGTTAAAGKCVVASATRDGQQLIAVILNSQHRWQDAQDLLNWGFGAWTRVQVLESGHAVIVRPVKGGVRTVVALVTHGSVSLDMMPGNVYAVSVVAPSVLRAPLEPSQAVGWATVAVVGQPTERVPLFPARSVRACPAPRTFWHWMRSRIVNRGNWADHSATIALG